MNNNAPVRASGGGRKRKSLGTQKSSITRINPPDELMGDAARRIWKQQSKVLIERGTFEIEDAPLLQAYCNAWQLMLDAEIRIANEGLTIPTADGSEKMHPVVNVRDKSVQQLSRLGSLLGLDPLTRMRMLGAGSGNGDDGQGENEFDEF
ncbi:phage terminase small subunit P27 family [Halomonas sp. HP20-15]|uniref:phage terminase small subunit P27 family n=1 Tax=Halomonas sp. HP20-15 TaxID=3085901 RepID=UPI0029820E0B|nr:phage terminase small subunit P27 family [Halomonas sp. HP20-15]MDW5376829.1 phage terminase small subunit P27 family [Halomonas sp. HP20-15]